MRCKKSIYIDNIVLEADANRYRRCKMLLIEKVKPDEL